MFSWEHFIIGFTSAILVGMVLAIIQEYKK